METAACEAEEIPTPAPRPCRPILLAALSGALLLLAAPPIGWAPLAFVALVPLLLALRVARLRRAAALGWVAGVVFHLGLVAWLIPTIARLQHGSDAVALAAFALYVGYHALQFALATAAARLAGCAPLATAAAWVLAEWAFPKVLPWALGATLGPHPTLRQGAALAGAFGLSALIVAVNALLAAALRGWPQARPRAGAALLGAGLLLAAALLHGSLAIDVPGGGRLRVGVVQAGDTPRDPDPAAAAAALLRRYGRLTARLAPSPDLVVWPEQVVRVELRHARELRGAVEQVARRVAAPLILGGLDDRQRSAAYLFAPTLIAARHKATLVPFGEYVPGAKWLPFLRRWRLASPLAAGPPAAPLDAGGGRLATAICFEAIRPAAYRPAVAAGAEVLLNLSDDSWFDSPWAAAQHLEMTRLRAVETRRWLVRASHSGISAVFDARGAAVARLSFGRAGALTATVERRDGMTPYARHGDLPLLLGAVIAWSAALARRAPEGIRLRRGRRAAPRSGRRRRGAPALHR